jgi:serine phosphatase RsbU (regulator of sigma subunit)
MTSEHELASSHDREATSSLMEVLDAVERLGEELAGRNPEDQSFQVSVPDDPPVVRALAELINDLGSDLDAYHRSLGDDMRRKSDELTDAYNALQAKNDDVQIELEMARKIQTQLIPSGTAFPVRPELDFGGFYLSMDNIGGDIYDVIRFGRNSYGLLIADVSGHGIPAALITALVKIAFRSKARFGADPSLVVKEVNADLHPILSDLDFFVTAFFAIIDLEDGSIRFANCGHHPALVARPESGELIPLDTPGRFLGFFDDLATEDGSFTLRPGDTVFFFTDGIIEARNFFDEEYQQERLSAVLVDSVARGRSASETVEAIRRDITRFCMDAEQRDDQSMFAVRINDLANSVPSSGEDDGIGELHSEGAGRAPGTADLLRRRAAAIYVRAKACVAAGEYLEAAGLFEALYLLDPKQIRIPPIIEKLRARAASGSAVPRGLNPANTPPRRGFA